MQVLIEAAEVAFAANLSWDAALRCLQRRYLRLLLDKHRGNQCRAAEELGVHRNTLTRHMLELGMKRARARKRDLRERGEMLPLRKRPSSSSSPLKGVTTKPSDWLEEHRRA